jgi:hypothetical protein
MLYSLGTIKAVNRNDRFTSIHDISPISQTRLDCFRRMQETWTRICSNQLC